MKPSFQQKGIGAFLAVITALLISLAGMGTALAAPGQGPDKPGNQQAKGSPGPSEQAQANRAAWAGGDADQKEAPGKPARERAGTTPSGASTSHATEGTAGTTGDVNSPQPISNADDNPGGANGQCPEGPYCSTRDGSPSENGKGTGKATGKPCAGCVGRADNKNPRGQMPNGGDHNAGYECDRNQGIGQGNPAHTSCESTTQPPVTEPPVTKPPVIKPPVIKPPTVDVPESVVSPPMIPGGGWTSEVLAPAVLAGPAAPSTVAAPLVSTGVLPATGAADGLEAALLAAAALLGSGVLLLLGRRRNA